MFIKTFTSSEWPEDLEFGNSHDDEVAYYDNYWEYMNRFPDYINSDTITNLVYDIGNWYFSVDGKYKDYYFVMAFVNWSKCQSSFPCAKRKQKRRSRLSFWQ